MAASVLEIFRERFRELVDEKGISLKECANDMGISYNTLNEVYYCGKNVRMRILIRIAKYFNVSTDYLIGLSDTKTRKEPK